MTEWRAKDLRNLHRCTLPDAQALGEWAEAEIERLTNMPETKRLKALLAQTNATMLGMDKDLIAARAEVERLKAENKTLAQIIEAK